MKKIALAVFCAFIISCKGTSHLNDASLTDSLPNGVTEAELRDSISKVVDKDIANSLIDTIGLYKAPVKVLSAKLFKKEYSNYRDIRLTYQNISKKTISGIKFRWYGTNAFGEAADMGNGIVEGFGGGFTDDELKPNRKETGEWSILSRDGKKVVIAWPIEVAFADGTSWKL